MYSLGNMKLFKSEKNNITQYLNIVPKTAYKYKDKN